MSISRVEKFDHKVEVRTLPDGSLIADWNGYKGRHDYIIAESLEDLDILVTELTQAVNNYKRKKLIYNRK